VLAFATRGFFCYHTIALSHYNSHFLLLQ